jgi:y4mF family transcriptional regulator
MTTALELGSTFALRRKELGLAQQELADLAGVSARSIFAIEHGKPTARLDLVLAIAETLGLELVPEIRR